MLANTAVVFWTRHLNPLARCMLNRLRFSVLFTLYADVTAFTFLYL